MLTPLFDISQDEKHIILLLRVPYMKTSSLDYYIAGTEFKFFAKPYFLRLNFPHPLAEDASEKLSYDVEKGQMTIILPKLTPGQFFENLGMITELLAKKKTPGQPTTTPVQVIASGIHVAFFPPWHLPYSRLFFLVHLHRSR